MQLPRRDFLKASLMASTGLALTRRLQAQTAKPSSGNPTVVGIVDTNVHLGTWPFRHLKYAEPDKMVAKLRRHQVAQAWAGSFDALFHKDIDGVNRRLTETCEKHRGFLLPFGAVNLAWPEWEEDLRRCHEVYKMPGVRLYPSFQGYYLSDPVFAQFLEKATARKLIVQISVDLEDNRVNHPGVRVRNADTDAKITVSPLMDVLKNVKGARIQFLNALKSGRSDAYVALTQFPNVMFDLSDMEGAGGLQKVIAGKAVGRLIRGKIPVDRLTFGSHVPYLPVQNALFKFMESKVSGPHMKAIMAGNAQRFLAAR